MGKLGPLVEKEVKDLLRDPRIYIGLVIPIIMLPLIGFAMSTAMRGAAEMAAADLKVAFVDYDVTNASRIFVSLLTSMGLNILEVSGESLDEALEEAKTYGSKALIIIPEGFEENLIGFGKIKVEVYSIIESVGIGSAGVHSAIDGLLDTSSKMLSDMLISNILPGVEPDVIRDPLNVTRYTVIKDRVVHVPPQAIFGQLMVGYGVMIPMVLFVLSITMTQIAATATAVENEEKTLETLLTFPVSRYDILMAKLLGSSIVAVLGGIMFTAGFLIYFQGLFGLPGLEFGVGDIFEELPSPPPETYVVLTISLILSIFFITSLGIVIGALSSDVRMSGSLLGIVIIPVLIPSLLIMYGDLKTMPLALQLFAYALPTSYPMIMAKEMIISTVPVEVLYGIPYSAALTLIVLYATSKLLAPEKLLTLQHKLKLKRVKRKQARDL
jgi:ABC-type Na+ efflux pump permease subunit